MRIYLTSIVVAGTAARLLAAAEVPSGPLTMAEHIRPVLKQFCTDCHNADKQKGDLDLTPLLDKPQLAENRAIWEKVVELVESREMPPEKKPQPSEAQRELLVKFIDGQLSTADCKAPQNPGRVTIRRLNREEYRNTIRDLMKVDFELADFPNDEVGHGFDNIGDVLSLPPMLMEKFLAAAEQVVSRAIVPDPSPKPVIKRIPGAKFESTSDAIRPIETGALGLYREGEASMHYDCARAGEYVLRIRAHAELAGPEVPRLAVRIQGQEVKVFEVANHDKGTIYEVRATFQPGPQKLAVAYLNNYVDFKNADPKLQGDRNLFVSYIDLEEPPKPAPKLPESHTQLITKMPAPGAEHACATDLLRPFMKRAYRRPVSEGEVDRVSQLVTMAMNAKGSFLEGMQLAVQAVLCSPHFLYRWELDPQALKAGESRALSDFEVASRLSYFLWSSMPDRELTELAQRGELRQGGNLEKQIARMLQDWKAGALVSNFGNQWLQIRGIYEISPDPKLFPKFKNSLRNAMKRESELFFEAVIKEDRAVTDLLDADFTFVNEKLARHYGIEGVKGEKFQRVTLPSDSPRGGVLTQGAVLLATSTPTRTSPVLRGKWILEQILGTPPPAAPPDVPPLAEENHVNQSASLRERFEQHRSKAECIGCHTRLDPPGFALENFDATGAWRDLDGKFPIDASGKLSGGKTFNGPREFKALLKADRRFVRTFGEKLMTYALGRGLSHLDKCALDEIIAKVCAQNDRISALISAIVTSDPFLKCQPELAQN